MSNDPRPVPAPVVRAIAAITGLADDETRRNAIRDFAKNHPDWIAALDAALTAAGLDRTEAFAKRARDETQVRASLSERILKFLRARFRDSDMPRHLELDDFLQEVLIVVLQKLDRFTDRGPDSFRAWLFTVASNKLRDLRRQRPGVGRGGTEDEGDGVAETPASGPGPETVAFENELTDAEIQCARLLPLSQRQVYMAIRRQGMSYDTIAQQTGRKPVTLRSDFKRGTDSVRACIRKRLDQRDELGDWLGDIG